MKVFRATSRTVNVKTNKNKFVNKCVAGKKLFWHAWENWNWNIIRANLKCNYRGYLSLTVLALPAIRNFFLLRLLQDIFLPLQPFLCPDPWLKSFFSHHQDPSHPLSRAASPR